MTTTAMTAVAVLCAVAAVLLALRPRPLVRIAAGAERRSTAAGRRPRRPARRRALATGVALLVVTAVAAVIDGADAAVPALAFGIAASTLLGLLVRGRDRRRHASRRRTVARATGSLTLQLRAGATPAEALRRSVEDWPVLAASAAVAELGGDPVEVWREQAREPGGHGLAVLARGWQLSVHTGAPLTQILDGIADSLADEDRLDHEVTAELAAPRATGKVMATLPLVGLALGMLLGGDPVTFLFEAPLGRACLLAGTGLAAVGVLWIERIAHQAQVGP